MLSFIIAIVIASTPFQRVCDPPDTGIRKFVLCLSGPDVPYSLRCCNTLVCEDDDTSPFDQDGDGDIDLWDFAEYQVHGAFD